MTERSNPLRRHIAATAIVAALLCGATVAGAQSIDRPNAASAGAMERLLAEPAAMFVARPGSTLRETLQTWAGQAGWSLVYETSVAYQINVGATFNGTFLEAVNALVEAYEREQPPPIVTLWVANKALVVTTERDQGD